MRAIVVYGPIGSPSDNFVFMQNPQELLPGVQFIGKLIQENGLETWFRAVLNGQATGKGYVVTESDAPLLFWSLGESERAALERLAVKLIEEWIIDADSSTTLASCNLLSIFVPQPPIAAYEVKPLVQLATHWANVRFYRLSETLRRALECAEKRLRSPEDENAFWNSVDRQIAQLRK